MFNDHIPPGKSVQNRVILAKIVRTAPGPLPKGTWASHYDRQWLILGRDRDKNLLAKCDWVATTPAAVLDLLQAACAAIDHRARALDAVEVGQRVPDFEVMHVCVDEGANLLTAPGAPDMGQQMRKLLMQGPSVGVLSSFRSAPDRRLIMEYAQITEGTTDMGESGTAATLTHQPNTKGNA